MDLPADETAVGDKVMPQLECPKCGNTDLTMLSRVPAQFPVYVCEVCSKEFRPKEGSPK